TSGSVTKTGTGTSVVTTTLDATNGAFDYYFVKVLVVTGGTIATGPCAIQVSLDAGRNYGQVIQLGVANTYVIANTGITLNFAAGTLVTGDTYTFAAYGPMWTTANVQTALNALVGSQYGVVGWGSTHIVSAGGGATAATGGVPGADATTLQGYLDSA